MPAAAAAASMGLFEGVPRSAPLTALGWSAHYHPEGESVDVRFGKVQLEKSCRDNARCYVQRIDQLYAAETARDLFALRALRVHAKGNTPCGSTMLGVWWCASWASA
jgi:hypothetical protein